MSKISRWLRAVKDLFKDIFEFLKIRKQQREFYGDVIEDLETIRALSAALHDQMNKVAKKWNLYPEVDEMVKNYRKYMENSQKVYEITRKDILNRLFAERNRNIQLTSEGTRGGGFVPMAQGGHVRRWERGDFPASVVRKKNPVDTFVKEISEVLPLLGRVLNDCEIEIVEGSVIIGVSKGKQSFLNLILKHRKDIESYCAYVMGEETIVEIVEKGE